MFIFLKKIQILIIFFILLKGRLCQKLISNFNKKINCLKHKKFKNKNFAKTYFNKIVCYGLDKFIGFKEVIEKHDKY